MFTYKIETQPPYDDLHYLTDLAVSYPMRYIRMIYFEWSMYWFNYFFAKNINRILSSNNRMDMLEE